jgi:hypothetical protein
MSSFKKAQRKQVKLKLALTGPSHAGKTFSALKIAKGMGGRIAVIDTENGSASLYSDTPGMPEYDTCELGPPFTSDRYMKAIDDAVKAGYDILIIDSISHQWNGEGGIIDRKDKEMIAKPGANSYALWSKYTPEHERFKQKILQAPIHIIATMRSKMEYVLEVNEKGRQAPKKFGMAPIQRDGFEYDFTIMFDLTIEKHIATATKDRTGLFDEKFLLLDETVGTEIINWINSGAQYIPDPDFDFTMGQHEWTKIKELSSAAKMTMDDVKAYTCDVLKKTSSKEFSRQEFDQLCQHLITKAGLGTESPS